MLFCHFNWDVDLVVATFLFNQLNGDLTADVSDEEPDHFGYLTNPANWDQYCHLALPILYHRRNCGAIQYPSSDYFLR